MSKILFPLIFLLIFSCDSKSPREKANNYIWYLDAFYFNLTDQQEEKLKTIVGNYFDSTKPLNRYNKEIYKSVLKALDENNASLPVESIHTQIMKRRLEQNKLIKGQLSEVNDFFETLSADQKRELSKKLLELKGKSGRLKFWLGD
jgi:hypothetical protein